MICIGWLCPELLVDSLMTFLLFFKSLKSDVVRVIE